MAALIAAGARIHQIYIQILGKAAQALMGGHQRPLRGCLAIRMTRQSALMRLQGDLLAPLAMTQKCRPGPGWVTEEAGERVPHCWS